MTMKATGQLTKLYDGEFKKKTPMFKFFLNYSN